MIKISLYLFTEFFPSTTSTYNMLNSEAPNLEKNGWLMGISLNDFPPQSVLLGFVGKVSLGNQYCLFCRRDLLLRNSQRPVFLIAILPSIKAEVGWQSNMQKYKILFLVLQS